MQFNKHNVKVWMAINYSDFIDSRTNELNLTAIVEAAAEAFNKNFEDGPLDDPDHWIWECPLELK